MKKYTNFFAIFFIISLYLITLTLYVVAEEFSSFNLSLLIACVVSTGLYFIWKRKQLLEISKTAFFKNFLTNVITVFLIAAILGMINYLVAKNDRLFDFTMSKIHSLSDQSKQVIARLKDDELKLTLFAKREDWARYLNLIRLYEKENSNVSLKVVDVDREPALVSLNQIEHNGTLLVEYKGRTYKSVVKDELAMTTLLMKVLRPKNLVLYYITGHNQLELESQEPAGASALKGMILGSNYDLKFWDLTKSVPTDAAGLIMLNPQSSLLEKELTHLEQYILRGGALFLAMAPRFNESSLAGLEGLLKKWGIKFINGIILDRLSEGQGGQASIPIVNEYAKDHPITKKFQGRTVYPVSAFYEILSNDKFNWEVIAKSTPFPASWGETNFAEVKSGKATYHKNKDFAGPMNIVLAGENKDSRIVVASSSSFVSNQFQGQSNNFNLFMNAISWMVNDEVLVSLDRPELEGNLIYISDMHLTMVFYFAIICFPFIFFGIAIFTYRYKLGR